jgi:hypothetical protein
VAIDGFFVLIRLPIREVLPELARLLGLVVGDFCVRGADCFLVLIRLPIREVLLELTRLLGLADYWGSQLVVLVYVGQMVFLY